MKIYDVGDRRKLIAQIRDEDGVLVDPTTVIFRMREPDNVITEYVYGEDLEVTKDSPGIYHVYWDCDLVGTHHWRYEATGSVMVAEEAVFRVRTPQVPAPVS